MYIRLASRHVAACLTAADHTKVQRLHVIARSGGNCEALVRFPHAVEILYYTINPTQALVLQTWRAIKYKDLGRLLTHARKSYMEVKSWEAQVRQCIYRRTMSTQLLLCALCTGRSAPPSYSPPHMMFGAWYGQEQLQEIHSPEAEAQIQREEDEFEASEQEIRELLSGMFGAYGTCLAAHSMLLSV